MLRKLRQGLYQIMLHSESSFARALEKASLDYEAGIQYHLACETDPNYLDSFILYGSHLQRHHRYDEALECLKRAEQLSPNNLDIFDQFGHTYLGMGNTEAALERFDAALSNQPDRITTLTGKEQVYQETGKLDQALEICDQIIKLDANMPTGHLLKARIKKSNPNDGLAEELLKYVANDNLDIKTQIILNFALGKVFDDQNKYHEAFKYYAIGNDLKNRDLNYDSQLDKEKISEIIDIFNLNLFKNHHHLGIDSDLPVIIVGMPRSGTSLTEQIISSHPLVQGAGEVIFWNRAKTAMPLRLNTETLYPECIAELTPEAYQRYSRYV